MEEENGERRGEDVGEGRGENFGPLKVRAAEYSSLWTSGAPLWTAFWLFRAWSSGEGQMLLLTRAVRSLQNADARSSASRRLWALSSLAWPLASFLSCLCWANDLEIPWMERGISMLTTLVASSTSISIRGPLRAPAPKRKFLKLLKGFRTVLLRPFSSTVTLAPAAPLRTASKAEAAVR